MNEFNGNREKSRVAADRDSRANEELRNYYRELDAAITDTRGITDQAQSGEGYSCTEFRESERVHANTEKADTDTGRRETDDLIRQAEIARRSSEAMIAANIAPGMNRQFTAEQWKNLIPKQLWYDTVEEAQDLMDADIQVDIQGYDIDAEVVKAARENAKRAGVDHLIHFQQRAVADLHHPKKYGFVITNPPYGERLEEKEDLPELYTQIGQAYAGLDSWSLYMITSYEDAERYIGRKADKNRKIYNGMIKTYFYQFMGPKPSKRREAAENTIERKEQQ